MKLLFIGDVHGQVNQYWKLLQTHKPDRSIQVGDFGFTKHHTWHSNYLNPDQHKVLFGNHDDTAYLAAAHSLGDWGFDIQEDQCLFWVRGAESIDRSVRVEDRDWWRDEELTIPQFYQAMNDYERVRPQIMVSHDCPLSVYRDALDIQGKSRTSQGLQAMLEQHQPQLWIFGHHHRRIDMTIGATRFVCLEELGTLQLTL
ncbi:hypothetical protein FAES_4042 [Fibrella aestuarina BUZ 2]|uniref:Calcineurin-like phosphoesterase domain-containing protein n=1 Tax=Fibrella aestuarina BUZ 2 TaxID=1166018 RepID=I0KD39_9BACT|nr:metallophosphoesterase [Fibrella aestuarina]CCH02042.1 hypothetical protein FAES_4042 [Fibrella aestuarina BUZ 2]